MSDITTGRGRVCKALGGLNEIYIFPYVQYLDSQIVQSGMVLSSFPATTIYRFYSIADPNFTERTNETPGGKQYDMGLTLTFPVLDSTNEFQKLLKKDYRMIVQNNNGLYRLLGAYKGGVFNNLNEQTGGSRAELSGYTIDYEASEELPALYISSLSGAGFTVSPDDFLLLEDGEFILLEENEFIILE